MSRYANYLLSDNDLLNNKNVYRCDIILYSIISQLLNLKIENFI